MGNSLNSNANGLLDEIDKADEALRAALTKVRNLLCRLSGPAEAFLKGWKIIQEGGAAPQGNESAPLDPYVVEFLKSRQETLEQAAEDWERVKEQYPFGVSDPLSFNQIIQDYFIPTPEEFSEDLELLAFVIGTATALANPTPAALAEWEIEWATHFSLPELYDKILNAVLNPIVRLYTCIYNSVYGNAVQGSMTVIEKACMDINCGECDFYQ